MKPHETIVRINDISIRKAAIIGGFSLLAISILAPIGYFGIIQNLIVTGDAATTVNNIKTSEGAFRIGIGCLIINAVLDLVIAWALYIVLIPVNKGISLLSAWFRIAYTVILVVALSSLVNVLQLLGGAEYLSTFEPNQLTTKVMLLISSYENVWNLGYVLFGIHLILLGYLVYKAGYFPKFLGILIIIAGLGYFIDAMGSLLSANYDLNIAIYTFIGEPLLLIWLLMRGFKGFGERLRVHL